MPSPHAIWTEPERNAAAETLLVNELEIHPLTARLLVNRGFSDPESACRFLNPNLGRLHDPFLLPDMDKAAHRVADAIHDKQRIFVHGDYDADGVTSTAVYVRAIQALGGDVIYRVPHRKRHGYDIKKDAVAFAAENGARLIVTTDCGVKAIDAVEHANYLGVPVVITDHHEPGAKLPRAHAIVNPHRADSQYPFPELAGVGVAFKTIQAVVRLMKPNAERSFVERFVDLVALGTIADMMPLLGENRIFARYGLEHMPDTKKVGLHALVHGLNINLARGLNATDVSFQLGPKINAVGRMDDPQLAIDLLLTDDASKANDLVQQLVGFTEDRRTTETQIIAEAEEILKGIDLPNTKFIVVSAPDWNNGVVGLVATRIVERYNRPTIVLSIDQETRTAKGSGRSIPTFDLLASLVSCEELLEKYGGHKGAAGVTLALDNVPAFQAALNEFARERVRDEDMVPKLAHDGWIDPSTMTFGALEEWDWLKPFGSGNERPVFASQALPLSDVRSFGQDLANVSFKVACGNGRLRCVAWRKGDRIEEFKAAKSVDLMYEPQFNYYNGSRSIELKVKAWVTGANGHSGEGMVSEAEADVDEALPDGAV